MLNKPFYSLSGFAFALMASLCIAQKTAPDPTFAPLSAIVTQIRQAKDWEVSVQPNTSLERKRVLARSPEAVSALQHLRQWLDQPSASLVPLRISEMNLNVHSEARNIVRLLVVVQYVECAEGRVRDAIEVTRDGLRLANRLQRHSLLSFLTGSAIEKIIAQGIEQHLEQLSVNDCRRLESLALEWEQSGDALLTALERERDMGLEQLKQDRSAQSLKEVEQAVKQLYRKIAAQIQQPYWERGATQNETDKEEPKSVAEAIEQTLSPLLGSLPNLMTQRLAQARLLGCHAAIRRYRWENGTLPTSLADLKKGERVQDPFTGQEFRYKKRNNSYTLESANPKKQDPPTEQSPQEAE